MLLLHPVSVKKILEELWSEKLEIQENQCLALLKWGEGSFHNVI